ncbi:DnaJ family domain-containing protein [Peribacillus muralis]|uniref:DnaJ family domain-containing protein n=1 Tax=Peribacillus muralis TaxID=264697 RepID=UPI00070E6111|nr:DnaJ family domain-containing protein [Peribacillus muralis]
MGNDQGHVNWMDQIFRDYEKDGGLRNNPGFGKPLPESALSGNMYDNFLSKAKDAGFLPLWIKWQKEIREELSEVVQVRKMNGGNMQITKRIEEINEKVRTYNAICPPKMQRREIEWESIESQYEKWK